MTIPSGEESGVAVVRYLLANNAPVVAVVPASRIIAGDLPLETAMPAISVTQVSSVPFSLIRTVETIRQHTDRVQVTVYRKAEPDDRGYPGLKSLLTLVLVACAGQRGTINGVAVDSIMPDIEGSDLPLPELSLYARSRDFIVRWST